MVNWFSGMVTAGLSATVIGYIYAVNGRFVEVAIMAMFASGCYVIAWSVMLDE